MEEYSSISETKISTKWYDEFPKAEKPCKHNKSDFEVLNLKEKAKKCLEAETSAFQLKQSHSRDPDLDWFKTAAKRGTTLDKVAATILLIQINPKYNLAQISFLLSMVKSAKHNQCYFIFSAVKDLFLSDLLHPTFKLLKFEEQDLDKINIPQSSNHQINKLDRNQEKWLAYIYFEDQVRNHFETFVSMLSDFASDSVEMNREKAIDAMNCMLIENSEQEHKILQLIVNKIGDPCSKVASKAVFCLLKLLYKHPNMKMVVLREVEKLLFRTNVSERAQYYSICLLTQFVLSKADSELATSLIEVYFAFFKACLKKGEPDSRMMAAILKGVSRTYNYAKCDSELLNNHINSLYKVVHIGSFNVSLNALNLLYHVEIKNTNQCNRYYTAFYRKLLDLQIGVASKRAIFLNLLHRVLVNDESLVRRHALVKRTLQTALYYPANMVCGILYTISRVLQYKKDSKGFFLSTQKLIKTEDNVSNANKINSSNNREIINSFEHNESKIQLEIDPSIMINVTAKPIENLSKQNVEVEEKVEDILQKPYDPFCRNPLYSNACCSMYFELVLLCDHFHPSVSLFANSIVNGKPINYTGDPLEDLTLIRFLDRYVFKNPKKLENKKVQKKNDPLALRAGYVPKGVRSLPVDSMAYLNENEKYIPVDELFLHRYLNMQKRSIDMYNDKDSDNESVNSEEFNELLGKLGTDADMDDFDIAANIGTIKNKQDDEEDESDQQMEDEEEDVTTFDTDDEYPSDVSISNDSNDNDAVTQQKSKHKKNKNQIDTNMFTKNDDSSSNKQKKMKKKHKRVDENSNDSFNGDTSDDDDYSFSQSKTNSKEDLMSLYVSADKFAEMLEEYGRTKTKHGGTDAFNTMDGASSKQIDWESKRNEKLTGSYSRKKRRYAKSSCNRNNKKIKH
ncbi:PREDICTED: CCAAT/enhancer-binding protein zeta [Polistes dominula]|uniref:CCAAT/enhancer-binding protein zeta n=1 Tax=Polistes dominula TaxID=743375 RepID=A0ABM1I0P2_POLDO|nr:PREDICTED: CCAAT/enhancer-binding protein zeta [Polistes dominula]